MQHFDAAISTPISSSASFSYNSSQEAKDIFSGTCAKPLYSRMGNPTSMALEEALVKMENGIACVATSSGMGAISMAILSLTQSDDEIIAVGGLFGGSYALMSQTLPRYGINTVFLSVDELDKIEENISTKTKIIFCETVGNPNLRLPELKKIGEIATKHDIVFMVDNTITPVIVKPFEYGADVIVYSTTKTLSGNSSALGGAAIFKAIEDGDKFHSFRYPFLKPFINKLGKKALFGCAKKRALRDFGMSANAHSSYQTLLGLETLHLRNKQVNQSCETIAIALQKEGLKVNHPSLKSSIDHELYQQEYKNGCGSMMTLDMENEEKAFAFLDQSNLITLTANIGDSRTLGLHMASTIYQDFSEEEKEFLGIGSGLIRISIGLEDPDMIINDFVQCFKSISV